MLLAMAMLATWLPHYLTWPWWPDLDAWATIARGWDAGIKPYRDVVIFNFPGHIYLAWILGKLFGWGRTGPFYAVDAAMLVGLGPLLAIWSRRRFGRALAGWIGWIAVLSIYLNLDYALVAQRDWHAPLLAVMALLVLQRWPGWVGTVVSSSLMALGFTIRPHVVLFLPAIALVFVCDRVADESWWFTIRRALAWGLAFAGFVAMAFAPLVVQGLIGDFIGGVRQASYGRGYGQTSGGSIIEGVIRQLGLLEPAKGFVSPAAFPGYLAGWKVLGTIAGLTALVAVAPPEHRRLVLPWILALILAILYEPLHPKRHAYLALPLRLVWAVNWGVLAGLVQARFADRPRLWPASFVLLLLVAVPGLPTFCRPGDALDALHGREPIRVPATAERHFFPGDPNTTYRWDDYRRALAYLKRNTRPETPVANALRNVPFPAFNGVLGRVSPFPAESGVIWLWSVNPQLEGSFISSLEQSPRDTVVVWSPEEAAFDPRLRLPDLRSAIHRLFRPEARFGAIEVWRKK
ncbi:MAG: hypothetical protein JWN86_2696 [Planctomycetota bacterium]|nr:hypothetical protein [Planctomycetota bacterium]